MKKKLFLLTAICLLSIPLLNAQFSKGKIILGISSSSNNLYSMYAGSTSNLMHLGFTTMKTKSNVSPETSEKIRTFNISPSVGYFIINNLAAGLDINYSLMSMGSGTNNETNSLFGIGPFIKYYVPKWKIVPFIEVGGSFGSTNDKYYNYNNVKVNDKTSITSFIGGIGFAVPVGDKVSFDTMVGYVSSTLKTKQNNPDNERMILGTFAVKLGFQLYLGANK